MSKEKTPIQELIEVLIDSKSKTVHQSVKETLNAVIKFALTFKTEEKKAIEAAYDMGQNDAAEGYYNIKCYTDKYGE